MLINKEKNLVEHVHGGLYKYNDGCINSRYMFSTVENDEGRGNKGSYAFRVKDGKMYQSGTLAEEKLDEVWDSVHTDNEAQCNDSISGLWEMKEALYNDKDRTDDLKVIRQLKMYQNGMFMVLIYERESNDVVCLHGGSYTYNGEKLIESIHFATDGSGDIMDKTFTFTATVKENSFCQEGKVLSTEIEEKWIRVQLE